MKEVHIKKEFWTSGTKNSPREVQVYFLHSHKGILLIILCHCNDGFLLSLNLCLSGLNQENEDGSKSSEGNQKKAEKMAPSSTKEND